MLFSQTWRKLVHGKRSSGTRHGKKQGRRAARRLVLESLEIRQLLCVSLPGPDEQAESGTSGAVVVASEETAQNAPPLAVDDAYAMRGDQQLGANVLANDADADGDPLAALLVAGPSNGTLVLDAAGPFTYKPDRGFEGVDSFTYQASDGQAQSNPATVQIAVSAGAVNSPPTAAEDSYVTAEDEPLSIGVAGVLANDQDVDGDALTAVLTGGPANGTLTLNADGSFDYLPNADFHGTDAFTYLANDGQADSAPATVTITVNPTGMPLAKELAFHLDVSGTAFGPDGGPIWGGSTFWVSAYVQDLCEVPLGVVGGAIDVQFDAGHVTPTGNVVYGERFTDYRQGTIDPTAGLIDEAGALATDGGAGAEGMVPFVSWQFRRNGPGAPNDPNSQVAFAVEPGGGTGTIHPANFALVGLGTPVDWANVQLDTVDLSLSLGDFNHDGAVNHYDLALWIPHALSSPGDEHFDPEYDLNADARVDPADLALLMPRLYQPVLNEAPPAPEAGPAAFSSASRAERPGRSMVSLADDVDLDWVASVAGRRRRSLGARPAKELAVDHVFHAADCWRLG